MIYLDNAATSHPKPESVIEEVGAGGDSHYPFQPDSLPDRFEAGTLNGPGIAGFGAAIQYILGEEIGSLRERELSLAKRLERELNRYPKCTSKGF